MHLALSRRACLEVSSQSLFTSIKPEEHKSSSPLPLLLTWKKTSSNCFTASSSFYTITPLPFRVLLQTLLLTLWLIKVSETLRCLLHRDAIYGSSHLHICSSKLLKLAGTKPSGCFLSLGTCKLISVFSFPWSTVLSCFFSFSCGVTTLLSVSFFLMEVGKPPKDELIVQVPISWTHLEALQPCVLCRLTVHLFGDLR